MSELPESPIPFDSKAPGVVECTCEFCGRKYWIDPNQFALAHEMPFCPEFQAMDILSFMIENRKIKEAKAARRPSA